jgi:hypothetical protein
LFLTIKVKISKARKEKMLDVEVNTKSSI